MEKAISDLVADQGFVRTRMTGDGNCFFNAIVYLLKERGIKTSMTALRRAAAERLIAEEEKYGPFFMHDKDHKREYAAATRSIARSRTWNTQMCDIVINVVADLVGAHLTIYNMHADGSFDEYTVEPTTTKVALNLLRLDDCHFDALSL